MTSSENVGAAVPINSAARRKSFRRPNPTTAPSRLRSPTPDSEGRFQFEATQNKGASAPEKGCHRVGLLGALVALAALSLHPSACYAGKVPAKARSPPPAPPPPPPAVNVTPYDVQWFFGCPTTASFIQEGDTITWTWFDAGTYSLEGDDDDSKAVFTGPATGTDLVSQKGFRKSITFFKAGTYSYHCRAHPYVMTGSVEVKAKYNFGGVELKWFLGISAGGASAIIRVGDTVSWRWADDLPHAITAQNGDLTMFTGRGTNNDTVTAEDEVVVSKKFTKAGVYLYKCQNHGTQMLGNITVLPKSATVPPAARASPSPPPDAQSPPPPSRRPPPKRSPPSRRAPPPPRKAAPPPTPSSCKPACNGRCYGGNGCQGTCPYPKVKTQCQKCCAVSRSKQTKAINACVAACKKS